MVQGMDALVLAEPHMVMPTCDTMHLIICPDTGDKRVACAVAGQDL